MNTPRDNDTDGLIKDLNKINELLNSLNPDRKKIVSNFPRWESQRETTISVSNKLRKELDKIYKNCSVGRGVATGVSILGSLTAVTGFFLSFNESTRSVGKELTKYGTAAGVAGGVASLSASAAEGYLNKGLLDEMRTTLRKDQQLTQELFPCLQRSEKLDSLFKKVFDTSILSDSAQDFFTVVGEIEAICKEGVTTYKDIANALSSSLEGYSSDSILQNVSLVINLEKLSEKVKFHLIEFCNNPRVQEATLEIYRSFKRSPAAFEFLKLGLMVMREMNQILRGVIFLLLASIVTSTLAKSVNTLNQGLFPVVGIAIDIVAIISIADDIKNGNSKYSKMLEDVIELLSLELSDMKRAYLSITKN